MQDDVCKLGSERGMCRGYYKRYFFDTKIGNGAEPIIESEECGSGGAYLPWSPWSVCNQECAGGVSMLPP